MTQSIETVALAEHPTWNRLQDQIGWYERASQSAQRWFRGLKLVQIAAAAIVPVMAALTSAVWAVGLLGSLLVTLEGAQQLFQFQERWIAYRTTCEALRREQALFEAGAGPYSRRTSPLRVLAERLEGVIAREHEQWRRVHQEAFAEPEDER
jgi:Protein of unknown function (DUF4231)